MNALAIFRPSPPFPPFHFLVPSRILRLRLLLFLQVTNPAIDPLRESVVMSLDVHLGAKGNAVEAASEANAGLIKLDSPVLNDGELQTVQASRAHKVHFPSFSSPLFRAASLLTSLEPQV